MDGAPVAGKRGVALPLALRCAIRCAITRRKVKPRIPMAALIMAAVAGCEGDGGSPEAFVVRDSAGVRIVESAAPAWDEGEGWSLDLDAARRYETDPADTTVPPLEYVLGAARLSDGTVVAADISSNHVLYFGPEGSLRRIAGRPGSGPGEFDLMTAFLRLPGDSIVVVDGRDFRAEVFDPRGELSRTWITPRVSFVDIPPIGFLADGTPIGRSSRRVEGGGDATSGPLRWRTLLLRFQDVETFPDTVADFDGGGGFLVNDGINVMNLSLPFVPRSAAIAVGSEVVHAGAGSAPEILGFGGDGSLRRVVRWAAPDHPVTPELRGEWIEGALRQTRESSRPRLRKIYEEEVPFPETLPHYEGIVAGRDGTLWVTEYEVGTVPEAPSYLVFDRDGRWLGRVEGPPRFRLLEAGEDYLLGAQRDELDVQSVLLIPVRR